MDGFSAAHAIYCAYPTEATFHAGVYGEPPPLLEINKDTEVIIVDFSYPNVLLDALCKQAATVTIIDHHLSFEQQFPLPDHENLTVIFDKEHSGAYLAWDYVCGRVPSYVRLVEDRDLWKFELPTSKAFHAGASMLPQTFAVWDTFMDGVTVEDTILDGTAILTYYEAQKANIIGATKRSMVLCGVEGLVCNAPPMFASDIGNELAKESGTFGATYYQNSAGETKFSLRSIGEFDVADLASKLGGGGHKNASGFTLASPEEDGKVTIWRMTENG